MTSLTTSRVLFLLIIQFILPNFSPAAVFGVDDRELIHQSSPAFELSRSTAVAILTSLYSDLDEQRMSIDVDRLDSLLCPSEKLYGQTSLAYACSGFLVAPNLIATAGHCMVNTGVSINETELYCEAYSWLFDYTIQLDVDSVDRSNLYHCKQIVYAINEDVYPYRDFALIELDRPVVGRPPLRISDESPLVGESLSMIGHPFGAPATLSKNAQVFVNNTDRQSFITSLDAFSGNSGSAVFNSQNEVVGILIAGTPSPETVKSGSCEIVNTCDDTGHQCLVSDDGPQFDGFQAIGSEVQKILPIQELICSF